jgi:hypothetical protein
MKAVPMRGKLTGKRIAGYLWAGRGSKWKRKENYFQLEDANQVTAVLATQSGSLSVRCMGATFTLELKGHKGEILTSVVLALPGGSKIAAIKSNKRASRRRTKRR